jgi:VIT1/CCC1 family predicted Fe2+/Mn2+ transporter
LSIHPASAGFLLPGKTPVEQQLVALHKKNNKPKRNIRGQLSVARRQGLAKEANQERPTKSPAWRGLLGVASVVMLAVAGIVFVLPVAVGMAALFVMVMIVVIRNDDMG